MVTASLRSRKGSTVPPQSDQALINQAAWTRGAPELRPSLTHRSRGSWRSLQRTVLLQRVTALWSPSSSGRLPDQSCVLASTQVTA